MKIIGIDVGLNDMGLAYFKDKKLIKLDSYKNKQKLKNGEKLCNLEGFVRKNLREIQPDLVAVEGTFWNPRQARGYSHVSAVIGLINKVAWEELKIEPEKIQPAAMKKRFTGNGRAKKEEIIEKVREIYKIDKITEHEADAVAIASCFLDVEIERGDKIA